MRVRRHLNKKKRSQLSERRAAKLLGGSAQPASGAINRADLKGDVTSKHFLLEDKYTDKKSYSFKYETWQKLVNEAFPVRKRPMFRVSFEGRAALYVIDESTLQILMEVMNES